MSGPENCGTIDMLFIISFCINYISQKWEIGKGGMGEGGEATQFGLSAHRVLLHVMICDQEVRLMKLSRTLCTPLRVCVCVLERFKC